ncbi:hypothetical protein BWQ96_00498 [Gracilariopsis chorda]|uniref:Uncharacterized protein n=1 Tax=Gracilariopsis chorda TaxID=448386 RepID=A0A2V3J9Z4_9FLOR|nr:hypothetical protein BWQ96_00498 [Gracilariopsis chorda]|eukprot:PXF49620.1 hypothetical protein BWQ96_00498 [Gracilariopsis chorda]
MSTLSFIFIGLCLSAASACTTQSTPFDSSLIGLRYGRAATCGPARFNAYSSVIFGASNITLSPLDSSFNHGGTPAGYVCARKLIFKFGNVQRPELEILPRVIIPPELGNDQSYCGPAQQNGKKTARPMGPTRQTYQDAVSETIAEVKLIRDYGCESVNGSPFPVQINNFKNVKADAAITYLYGIAHRYRLCL